MDGAVCPALVRARTILGTDEKATIRIMLYRWTHRTEADRHEWMLKRNCALRPDQLACWFGSLAVLTLVIGAVFAAMGAWLVVPFTLIEISALVAAFIVFSRHATDYERIVVRPGEVVVETSVGLRTARIEEPANWVRVEYSGRHHDLIRVVTPRQALSVGRFVPGDTRGRLAVEMRNALLGRVS